MYGFSLQIPINIPSEEEIVSISSGMEKYLQALVDSGHANAEEITAYLQFTSYLSGITPFLMDAFLETYRGIKRKESGLILPA